MLSADGSCERVFCDSNAECLRTLPEGRRQCKCRDGWQGDGRTCSGKTKLQLVLHVCKWNKIENACDGKLLPRKTLNVPKTSLTPAI